MLEAAAMRSRLGNFVAYSLIVLTLVLSPLVGLVTPYLIGLVGLLLLITSVVTGRALRVYGGLLERVYLGTLAVIALAFALSARAPADVVFAANFSMLLLFAPMLHLFAARPRPDSDRILSWLALAGLGLALAMIITQALTKGWERPTGFNIGPIVLSNAAIALSVIAMLPLIRGRNWSGLLLLAAPLLGLAIVLITASRGPLLAFPPLALVTAWFVWRTRFPSQRWFPLIALAVLAGVAAAALPFLPSDDRSIWDVAAQLFSGANITNSAARARLVFQEAGWKAFLDSPWIGHGWARLVDAVVPYLRPEDLRYANLPQLHNDVLNFAVSGGVVGIGCYLAILTAPTIAAWRSVRDSFYATRLYGTSALMVVYAAAGLTDLMFGHEFHTAFYITLNAIILGMCRDAAPLPPQAT